MSTPILATKLYAPPPRPAAVARPRLVARLNDGLKCKLTLVSAAAGFGKTMLVSQWAKTCGRPVAWLSLDADDSDSARFLSYVVSALQTVEADFASAVLAALRAPQPPPLEAAVTMLLNSMADIEDELVLVIDDYHHVESSDVDRAMGLLIERMPSPVHLVIATREDPQLPLARLRGRGELMELRAADLRFTPAEAGEFFKRAVGLVLSDEDAAALDTRAEGWIAGLQLAALSLQSETDIRGFIQSFTGTHRFVMDYLLEEVLNRQPAAVQSFLLRTAILERMCGPLCDAVAGLDGVRGQSMLEQLERDNMFIMPLDNERRWYRYHHLFADLLRQRLLLSADVTSQELHVRASRWHEANGAELEAFQHAGAAGDIARASRLMSGGGLPLHFRGAAAPVLRWLRALPPAVLDAQPELLVAQASAQLFVSQLTGIEELLRAAEARLDENSADERVRDLIGHVAVIRATVAVSRHDADAIFAQSSRALAHLHPSNLPVRTATLWTLGYAYQLLGQRDDARRAYVEAIDISERIGHGIIHLTATIGLGAIQLQDTQLCAAEATYHRALALAGDPPMAIASEAHLGLAGVHYVRNDLAAALLHVQLARPLAQQIASTDRLVACDVFEARLRLAHGDALTALSKLAQATQLVRAHDASPQIAEIADLRVRALLRHGDTAEGAAASASVRPPTRVRVLLAQGDPLAALRLLGPLRDTCQRDGRHDDYLTATVLTALAHQAGGVPDAALRAMSEAVGLAEPEAQTRVFVDEGRQTGFPDGAPMQKMLGEARSRGIAPKFVAAVLAAFQPVASADAPPTAQGLNDPLSTRELELLHLVAQGLSNQEICARLFLALDTVKGHNRRIYVKLAVQRRTEAVARARALGILPA